MSQTLKSLQSGLEFQGDKTNNDDHICSLIKLSIALREILSKYLEFLIFFLS